MREHLTYRLLGETVDDAAGEAFDKVGRLLGLPYRADRRSSGRPSRRRAMTRRSRGRGSATVRLHFSGLKTAARRTVDEAKADEGVRANDPGARLSDEATAELAWGFQDAVVDVLATKTIRAAEAVGARSIVLAGVGGERAASDTARGGAAGLGLPLVVPRPELCTDNGAMIGAAAARLEAGDLAGLELDARPSLPLARAEARSEAAAR